MFIVSPGPLCLMLLFSQPSALCPSVAQRYHGRSNIHHLLGLFYGCGTHQSKRLWTCRRPLSAAPDCRGRRRWRAPTPHGARRSKVAAEDLHSALVDARQVPIVADGIAALGGPAWKLSSLLSPASTLDALKSFADIKVHSWQQLVKTHDLNFTSRAPGDDAAGGCRGGGDTRGGLGAAVAAGGKSSVEEQGAMPRSGHTAKESEGWRWERGGATSTRARTGVGARASTRDSGTQHAQHEKHGDANGGRKESKAGLGMSSARAMQKMSCRETSMKGGGEAAVQRWREEGLATSDSMWASRNDPVYSLLCAPCPFACPSVTACDAVFVCVSLPLAHHHPECTAHAARRP
jgi:hypothetical protein